MSMADRLDSSPTKRVKTLEAQAKEAQQTIEELRARDALKTQFLSNVSHDLRTPLAAIITNAETLREGMLGELNQKQRDSVSGIVSGGQQLIDMIDEILTYVRSASDQVNLVRTDFDITELVDQVRTLNQALAAKKHLTIERMNGDDLPLVYADRDKIKHVLGNLIGNAIKFTPDGGRIWISFARRGRNGDGDLRDADRHQRREAGARRHHREERAARRDVQRHRRQLRRQRRQRRHAGLHDTVRRGYPGVRGWNLWSVHRTNADG